MIFSLGFSRKSCILYDVSVNLQWEQSAMVIIIIIIARGKQIIIQAAQHFAWIQFPHEFIIATDQPSL